MLSDAEPPDDTSDRNENYLVMEHRQENVSVRGFSLRFCVTTSKLQPQRK